MACCSTQAGCMAEGPSTTIKLPHTPDWLCNQYITNVPSPLPSATLAQAFRTWGGVLLRLAAVRALHPADVARVHDAGDCTPRATALHHVAGVCQGGPWGSLLHRWPDEEAGWSRLPGGMVTGLTCWLRARAWSPTRNAPCGPPLGPRPDWRASVAAVYRVSLPTNVWPALVGVSWAWAATLGIGMERLGREKERSEGGFLYNVLGWEEEFIEEK